MLTLNLCDPNKFLRDYDVFDVDVKVKKEAEDEDPDPAKRAQEEQLKTLEAGKSYEVV